MSPLFLLPLLFPVLMLAAPASGPARLPADLVLLGGTVFTAESGTPWAEGCAIQGDRIAAIGSSAELRSWIGPRTRVIDLAGRLVLPGFHDGHLHFASGGLSLLDLDLRGAEGEQALVSRLATAAAGSPAGEWIIGGLWDHENWPSHRMPDRTLIDPATPRHPVLIDRACGHIALANSLALKLAGIDRNTANPPGGEIVHDPATGEPTGLLKDNAADLVARMIPPVSGEKRRRAIEQALSLAARFGITSISDNTSGEDLAIYQQLRREGKLTLRVHSWTAESHWESLRELGIAAPFGDHWLRLGTVKLFADGALGARSALLFDPYLDDPGNRGIPIHSREKLIETIGRIDRAGLQVAVHAIGDQANRWVLDALAAAREKNGRRDARHRIEHAQVVRDEDLLLFAELEAIASIQPSQCINDMRWADQRIGQRSRGAYRNRSLLSSGARLAYGTDWPVEGLDPRIGLYAAVTREYPGGGPAGGWHPAEKVTLAEAVIAYTAGPARAAFHEGDLGTLAPQKLADLVVLERNWFQLPPQEILKTRVDLTVVGGRVVYEREPDSLPARL